jgi:hypothetical protein
VDRDRCPEQQGDLHATDGVGDCGRRAENTATNDAANADRQSEGQPKDAQ